MHGRSWPLLPTQMSLWDLNRRFLNPPIRLTEPCLLPEGRPSSHPFCNGSTPVVLITFDPCGGPFLPSKRPPPGCDLQPTSLPALLRLRSPARSPRWESLSIHLTDLLGDLAALNGMLPYAFLRHRASVAYRILPAPQEYSNVVFVATDIP